MEYLGAGCITGSIISGLAAIEPAARPRPLVPGSEVGGELALGELGGGNQFVLGADRAVQRGGGAGLDRGGPRTVAPAMLSLSSATRVFVALEPVDMRQSFNGLYARVQTVL